MLLATRTVHKGGAFGYTHSAHLRVNRQTLDFATSYVQKVGTPSTAKCTPKQAPSFIYVRDGLNLTLRTYEAQLLNTGGRGAQLCTST